VLQEKARAAESRARVSTKTYKACLTTSTRSLIVEMDGRWVHADKFQKEGKGKGKKLDGSMDDR
jgi:hypothetical protein